MDAIKASSLALENSLTPRKGHRVSLDIEKAIGHLSSILTLLELSAPSATTFTRLAELLRQQLLPLYRASFSLALNYAVSVFCFIHSQKIVPFIQAKKPKYEWEILLKSLLSGILDFLEGDANANGTHRDIVASTLFPVLCPLYFATTTEPALRVDDGLTSIVYMLLTTIVDGHGKNATKLRDQIGSGRFGLTISQTKGFLSLETILDLFATLLPPLKNGRVKRTEFIQKVFDASLFICSKEIIHSLESISSSDWSKTASSIMELLAQSDISYPQSFEISRLSAVNTETDAPLLFFVDEDKFIGNIDQGGNVDTFQLPFYTIKTISVSPANTKSMQITVEVTKPPILGDQTSPALGQDISVSWSIKNTDVIKFKDCLKNRKLNFNTLTNRKQSKTGEIKLDFDSHGEGSLKSKTEKVHSLSQLWKSGTTSGTVPQTDLSTSPLVPQSTKSLTIQKNPADTPPSLPRAAEVPPAQFLSPNKQLPSKVQDTGLSDDDVAPPKSRVMKLKRKVIAASEDDGSDNEGVQTAEKGDILNPEAASKLFILPTKELTRELAPTSDNVYVKESTPVFEQDRSPKKKFLLKPKKRKTQDMEEELGMPENTRAAKHSKVDHQPSALLPYSKRRYGGKGRTSSPQRTTGTSPIVDFDAIPPSDIPKSRAVAMKGKKRRPAKRPPTTKKTVKDPQTDRKVGGIKNNTRPSLDPDITLVNSSETVSKDIDVQVTSGKEDLGTKRRSARVANYVETTDKVASGHVNTAVDIVENRRTKKLAKAPWEADDFMEKISSDLVMGPMDEMQNNQPEDMDAIMVPENDSSGGDIMPDDNGVNKSYSDDYIEFTIPAKLGSDSDSHPSEPAPTSVMIDLTLDEEEEPPKPKVSHVNVLKDRLRPVEKSVEKKVNVISKVEEQQTKVKPKVIPRATTPKDHARPDNKYEDGNAPRMGLKAEDKKEQADPKDPILDPPQKAVIRPAPRQPDTEHIEIEAFDMESDIEVKRDVSEGSNVLYANQIPRIEKMPPPPPKKLVTMERTERKVNFDLPESGLPANRKSRAIRSGEGHSTARRIHAPNARVERRTGIKPPVVEEQPPMDKIIEILKEINEAVICRVTERFEGVTEELYAGQRVILEGTADTLQEMRNERVRHFNDMVDLEGEYTTRCKDIEIGVHGYLKSTEQLAQTFKGVVLDHSRQSLSTRLPTSLFT